MEGNLSRARSLSINSGNGSPDSPTYRRFSRQSPPRSKGKNWSLSIPRSRNAVDPTAPASAGHSRVFSEASMMGPLSAGLPPTTQYPERQRSSSAMGSIVMDRISHGADNVANGGPISPRNNTDSPRLVTPLEVLSEDGTGKVSTASRLHANHFDRATSVSSRGISEESSAASKHGASGINRVRSNLALRDLREQMQDLKGKITSLKQRTRDDALQRRSMQSLKTPSPFTEAKDWSVSPSQLNLSPTPMIPESQEEDLEADLIRTAVQAVRVRSPQTTTGSRILVNGHAKVQANLQLDREGEEVLSTKILEGHDMPALTRKSSIPSQFGEAALPSHVRDVSKPASAINEVQGQPNLTNGVGEHKPAVVNRENIDSLVKPQDQPLPASPSILSIPKLVEETPSPNSDLDIEEVDEIFHLASPVGQEASFFEPATPTTTTSFESAFPPDTPGSSDDQGDQVKGQGRDRHEDRPDAFDYEHFFLSSTLGPFKRHRKPSTSSSGSELTTRPRRPSHLLPITNALAPETDVDVFTMTDDDDAHSLDRTPRGGSPAVHPSPRPAHSRHTSASSASSAATFATAVSHRTGTGTSMRRDRSRDRRTPTGPYLAPLTRSASFSATTAGPVLDVRRSRIAAAALPDAPPAPRHFRVLLPDDLEREDEELLLAVVQGLQGAVLSLRDDRARGNSRDMAERWRSNLRDVRDLLDA